MRSPNFSYPRTTIVIILSLFFQGLFSQPSVLWGDLKPGQYKVGFKVMELHDGSRRWRNERSGRPIQTSVWYPADVNEHGLPLTYLDYFLLSATEVEFTPLTKAKKEDAVRQYKELLFDSGIPKDAVNALFSTRMFAVPNMAMAKDTFPLLVFVQGSFLSAHHQSVLCEFLASHGYVVATCPSQTRISGPMKSEEDVYGSASEQAEDIAFVRHTALENFKIDPDRIGLVGQSFGARSALVYLAQNHDVKALVSLDGGIGNRNGKDYMKDARGFDPNTVPTPILHFYEDMESFMIPDFDLINSLKNSDRFLVKVERLKHIQFTTFGMAGGTIPGIVDNTRETKLKCEAIYRFVLYFVDTFVKKNTSDSRIQVEEAAATIFPKDLMHLTRITPSKN